MQRSEKYSAPITVLLTTLLIALTSAGDREQFEAKGMVTAFSQEGIKTVKVKLDRKGNITLACAHRQSSLIDKNSYRCTSNPEEIIGLTRPEIF